jgi:hypothetical protein
MGRRSRKRGTAPWSPLPLVGLSVLVAIVLTVAGRLTDGTGGIGFRL